jgi:hypothetical protein
MFAGRAGANAGYAIRRAVLAFDFAGVIPPGATVQNADLQLYMFQTIVGPMDLGLHALTGDWGEGSSVAPGLGGGGGLSTNGDATWIHRSYPSSNWASAGGDFVPTASATRTVDTIGPYTWSSTAQLVADIQGWVDSPSTNFGWILIGDEQQFPSAKAFHTREHATPSLQPMLTVTWLPPAATVTSTGTGCTGSGAQPFTLGATGTPIVGSAAFALTLANGPSSAPAYFVLAFGLEAVPLPIGGGCNVYLGFASLSALIAGGISPVGPVPLSAAGGFKLPLVLPNDPGLMGAMVDIQGLTLDPATGYVTSNALTLRFGA